MEYLASQDPRSYSPEKLSGLWRNVPKLGIAQAFREVDLLTILLA